MHTSIKSLFLIIPIMIGGCGDKVPDCGDQKVLELAKNQFEPEYRKAILDMMITPENTQHWTTLLDFAAHKSANALNLNVLQVAVLFKNGQAPFTFARDVSNINLTFSNPRVVEKKPDVGMAICEVNILPKGVATAKLGLVELEKLYQQRVNQLKNPAIDKSAMSNLEAIEGGGKEATEAKISPPNETEKASDQTFFSDFEEAVNRTNLLKNRKIEIDKTKKTITESFDLSVGSKEVPLKYSAQKDSNGQLIVKILDQ